MCKKVFGLRVGTTEIIDNDRCEKLPLELNHKIEQINLLVVHVN